MREYITNKEIEHLLQGPERCLQKHLYVKMYQRVQTFIQTDSLKQEAERQQEWYHLVWGKLSDACFAYRVTKDKKIGQWIHNRVMEMVVLDEDAWVGPWFRPRKPGKPVGTLETAKIAFALCEAVLNASDVFSEEEMAVIQEVMSEKALVLLGRHIDKLYMDEACNKNNWFMVTNCAYGMTAAALGREKEVQHSLDVLKRTLDFFDKDSYGEPLNYAEMASTYVNLLCDVLYRLGYIKDETVELKTLANMLPWYVASIQQVEYAKEQNAYIPMAFNFGDSNLHMYFQSDKFVRMASRLKEKEPILAGLASWLFHLPYQLDKNRQKIYADDFYGLSYLGLLALPGMTDPVSPKEAGFLPVQQFEIGHILARDNWENPRMTLAVAAGGKEMKISSHKHPDQNSFLLTVGKERFLIDPGMCCYRLWSQQHAKAECSHNVSMLSQNETLLSQHLVSAKMTLDAGMHVNELQVFERFEDAWIIVSDAGKLYDKECVEKAARIWVFTMPNMMFVADYVVGKKPLKMETNFVLNNEDNKLKTNVYNTHRLVFRRGSEALKLFNPFNQVDGENVETELLFDWTFAHHRYGIQPNSQGQAKEGSGLIYRWTTNAEGYVLKRIHTLMMDEEKNIKYWHLREADDFIRLEAPDHENTLDFKFTENGFSVRRKGQTKAWELE